ncbi:MAG: type I-B CRISPR-associated protein Cas7/Csh2 [Bacteroidetes bacterium]|nr:type I-B CRISPR-associated protein Cas7/Csh2 [Bacteroidota bacterium]
MLRSELLFCYDIQDANPNGDPLDSNKPRIDEETGKNIVTDVRLKRTVRDFLHTYKGFDGTGSKDIFIRTIEKADGSIQDGKTRAKDFGKTKPEMLSAILKQCIDVRLFGGVLPLEGDSITLTGPVQFKMGRSLNIVELKQLKGTGAFATTDDKSQKGLRDEYILPYSFIAFHGIVNQEAGKHTHLTDADVNLLLEGLWFGTQNLISRSKFGQQPRLLIKVNYKNPYFFIGDLDSYLNMKAENTSKVRGVQDFELDLSGLVGALALHQQEVDSVEFIKDPNLKCTLPLAWKSIKF